MAEAKKRDIVANKLRKDILAGKYGREGGIPDEGELAKISNCARGTVVAALTLLEGEGLVVHRGRSYYVNSLPVVMTRYVPPAYVRYAGRINYVQTIGNVERTTLPVYLAEKLETSHTTPVVSCVRVAGETVDGKEKPVQLSVRYYFMPLSDEQVQRMQSDPSYDPAWDGSGLLGTCDEVASRPVTQEEQELLLLPASTSVLSLLEIIRDKAGALYMAHESALSPRSKLIFGFSFENKPRDNQD